MIEWFLDWLSQLVNDRTDGIIDAQKFKGVLRLLGVISPIAVAWYFFANYWESNWRFFEVLNWPQIFAVILIAATVVFLFLSWRQWGFSIFEASTGRAAIILMLDIAFAGCSFWAVAIQQEYWDNYFIEAELDRAVEKVANRIKNPKVIFDKIASARPVFVEDTIKSFIGSEVEFSLKFVDAKKGPELINNRCGIKSLPIGHYELQLVCEENGVKLADVRCSLSLGDNPNLIELKGGERFTARGEIECLDVEQKIIWLGNKKELRLISEQ